MSHIKSWADHCSSDEESDGGGRIAPPPSDLPGSESYVDGKDRGDRGRDGKRTTSRRDFVPPESPPFTAYVGNLSYDIRTSNELKTAMDGLLEEGVAPTEEGGESRKEEYNGRMRGRSCLVAHPPFLLHACIDFISCQIATSDMPVKVKMARLMTDKSTGESRGYGYVEFHTKQEVRPFLAPRLFDFGAIPFP